MSKLMSITFKWPRWIYRDVISEHIYTTPNTFFQFTSYSDILEFLERTNSVTGSTTIQIQHKRMQIWFSVVVITYLTDKEDV